MRPLSSITAAAGLIALGVLAPHASMADSHASYVVHDGIVIYYAVIPAAKIRTSPKFSPERRMHGGIPKGRDAHHLMVALFDADTFERIEDAKVTTTVAEVGFAGKRKQLEPFVSNDALTYCNYFRMARRTDYRVNLTILRPQADDPAPLAFTFRPAPTP